jgi:myosin-light-chain kinase
MSCEGDSVCLDAGPDTGSKRHSDSGSSPKIGKCESPDSKPSGSQNFMSLYIFVKLLGCGAFGVVNLMQHLDSGKHYAVKVIKKTDPHTNAKTLKEINLGIKLDSQYVCKVHSYHEDDEHFYIVMEYLEGMDLCDFILKDPTFFINNLKFFWFVVESILRGLAYLHSQGIAHMDIKPENVFLLLDNQGNIIGVKLIDLGLSISINEPQNSFKGTPTYMAPDFFSPFCKIDCSVDIWSFGITAFAMIKASLPTQIISRKRNPKNRRDEVFFKISSLLSTVSLTPFEKRSEDPNIAQIEELIILCLTVDRTNRPTAAKLLKDFLSAIPQISL